MEITGAGLFEYSRGIKCNDVDSTHLLRDHDGEAGKGGAADAGDGEELGKAREEITLSDNFLLDLELRVDVIQVSCGLERMIAQP